MGSIIMPKIRKEEIIKAVERYKKGETSQKAEAKKQGVSHQTFQDWIRRYETFGSDGFWNTGNRKYPSSLKESAVKAYLNGEGSHAEICKKTEFLPEHSCKIGLRCIMVIKNYDPAEVEGVISI